MDALIGSLDRKSCRKLTFTIALLLCGGCTELSYEGWTNQPIPIAFRNGVPLASVSMNGGEVAMASISSETPLSMIDSARQPGWISQAEENGYAGGRQIERTIELNLHDGDAIEVTRFIFQQFEVLDLPLREVGLIQSSPLGAVLGVNLMIGFSVRLEYHPPRLTLNEELADSSYDLAADCDGTAILNGDGFQEERCVAVIRTPLVGAGKIVFGSQQRALNKSRLVVDICLSPGRSPDLGPGDEDEKSRTSGLPISGLVATGCPATIITRSAYKRVVAASKDSSRSFPEAAEKEIVFFGGEEITSERGHVDGIAVVGSVMADLGPCAELALRRTAALQAARGSADMYPEAAPAAALATEMMPVSIVPDDARIIEELRSELGSQVAEVEIILGSSFLQLFILDIDYGNERILLQCHEKTAGRGCEVYPACGGGLGPGCDSG